MQRHGLLHLFIQNKNFRVLKFDKNCRVLKFDIWSSQAIKGVQWHECKVIASVLACWQEIAGSDIFILQENWC